MGLSYQMIVVPGDGIRPEVTSEAVRKVLAAGVRAPEIRGLATAAVSTTELTDAIPMPYRCHIVPAAAPER